MVRKAICTVCSMVPDADEQLKNIIDLDNLAEPVYKIPRDPRLYCRFGHPPALMIPQLINVLRGDMSVVGPRPEWVGLAERYPTVGAAQAQGQTGHHLAIQQVMSRGDPSLAKRIELDLYYLKHQGFFLDVFIMLRTILVVCRGDGID